MAYTITEKLEEATIRSGMTLVRARCTAGANNEPSIVVAAFANGKQRAGEAIFDDDAVGLESSEAEFYERLDAWMEG
jgi:hypothetical protein